MTNHQPIIGPTATRIYNDGRNTIVQFRGGGDRAYQLHRDQTGHRGLPRRRGAVQAEPG